MRDMRRGVWGLWGVGRRGLGGLGDGGGDMLTFLAFLFFPFPFHNSDPLNHLSSPPLNFPHLEISSASASASASVRTLDPPHLFSRISESHPIPQPPPNSRACVANFFRACDHIPPVGFHFSWEDGWSWFFIDARRKASVDGTGCWDPSLPPREREGGRESREMYQARSGRPAT